MTNPQPGDIFVSSWGYEQTNVDFFEVIKVKGDWITLREIEYSVEMGGGMTGRSVPAEPFEPKGQPFRRKLQNFGSEPMCKIQSYSYARPWDGQPMRVSYYA